ncbi:MAG: hypothetical protein HYX48_05290 [Chlamydiales bacterium]|nr:hypothetical protein [Chlamydiales bacterium]
MKRKLPTLLALIFLLLILAIIALPTLLSTSWGKEKITTYLERKLPYQIAVNELSLSWLGPQKIQGVQIVEREGEARLSCEEIHSSASLIQILFKKEFKDLEITRPVAAMEASAISPTISYRQQYKRGMQRGSLVPSLSWKASPLPVSGHIKLKDGELSLYNNKIPVVRYYNLQVDADLPSPGSNLRIDLSGSTKEEQIQGTFHLLAEQSVAPSECIALSSEFNNFPLSGLDALLSLAHPEYQGLLTSAIGPSLNLTMQGDLSAAGLSFNLNASSALLQAAVQTAFKDGLITLLAPGKISLTLTPDFAARLVKIAPALSELSLKKNLNSTITISSLSLPIKDEKLDLASLSFTAGIETSPTTLLSKATTQQIDLDSLELHVTSQRLDQGAQADLALSAKVDGFVSTISAQGKVGSLFDPELSGEGSWSASRLSLGVIEELAKQKSKIAPFLGATLDASGSFKLKRKALAFTVQMTAPNFSLSPATFTYADKLTLTSPATLRFAPSKELLTACLPAAFSMQPSWIEMNIQELLFPVNEIEELTLKADLRSSPLIFDKFGEFGPLSVDSCQGRLEINSLKSMLMQMSLSPCSQKKETCALLNITTQAALDSKKSEFHSSSNISFSLQDVNAGNLSLILDGKQLAAPVPNWTVTLDAKELSVSLFDKLLQQQNAFTSLLGPTLNVHLEAQKEKVEVKATSANLNLHGTLSAKNNTLFLVGEPMELFFTLNGEGFSRIKSWLAKTPATVELLQPSICSFTISSLNIPLTKDLSWKDLQIVANGGIDKFAFQEKGSGQSVKFDQLILKLQKKEKLSPLSFQLTSQVSTKEVLGGKAAEGKIECIGSLQESSDLKRPSLELDATIEQLPSSIFDLVAQLTNSSSLAPLFGNALDAKAHVSLKNGSGPVQLNLKSPNSRFSIAGVVTSGVLTLSEPIHAQVLMTEELTRPMLKEVNPLSISSITSSHPLTLEVQPDGFSLPLDNWKKLSLSKAKIELGQIQCENQGAFQVTLGLLKSKQFSGDKQLHLWFAPIELSIKEGAAIIERTEILIAQTFEVAMWGKLNLIDENVDMILGLTSQCLSKAFSIQDLPPDYVMQIPMKGKMNDVQINTKAATAKIAALLIWQQKSLGGGLPGIAGDLLGKLATLPDSNSPTPPAKHPFPWESGKPATPERKRSSPSSPSKKKSGVRKEDKPLKQLLKILK